jgi:hypothetical protein
MTCGGPPGPVQAGEEPWGRRVYGRHRSGDRAGPARARGGARQTVKRPGWAERSQGAGIRSGGQPTGQGPPAPSDAAAPGRAHQEDRGRARSWAARCRAPRPAAGCSFWPARRRGPAPGAPLAPVGMPPSAGWGVGSPPPPGPGRVPPRARGRPTRGGEPSPQGARGRRRRHRPRRAGTPRAWARAPGEGRARSRRNRQRPRPLGQPRGGVQAVNGNGLRPPGVSLEAAGQALASRMRFTVQVRCGGGPGETGSLGTAPCAYSTSRVCSRCLPASARPSLLLPGAPERQR